MISLQAKKHLLKSDPKMAELVRKLKIERFSLRENHFRSLVGSIGSQQLSTKAAHTIRERMIQALGSRSFTHKHILKTPFAKLRAAGLSGSKVRFIKGLAKAMDEKKLDFKKLQKLQDEQAIQELIKHKGVGRWTAEMFLIFSLGRQDVFSHGDGGLKNAIMKIYKPKSAKDLERITAKWKPYRSAASIYLWASLDNK